MACGLRHQLDMTTTATAIGRRRPEPGRTAFQQWKGEAALQTASPSRGKRRDPKRIGDRDLAHLRERAGCRRQCARRNIAAIQGGGDKKCCQINPLSEAPHTELPGPPAIQQPAGFRLLRLGRACLLGSTVPSMRHFGHSRARDWQVIGANEMVVLPS
jgi:hypothetical protein